MARKSRQNQTPHAAACGTKIWRTALYLRLSREDGDKAESESIASQRDYLLDYIASHEDLVLHDVYIDDGWSGTSFARPEFTRMISDVEQDKINCVIVKDLSRLGRNYIEAGHYLETFFPLHNTRIIAVNDNIDSYANPAGSNSIIVPVKNILNDEYCRDISGKVRSSLDTRRAQGKYIGSFPLYGYTKDPSDHNKLVIDEEAASVVKEIFSLFIGGKSILGIAKHLNALGIPNPSEYKRQQGMNYRHPAGEKLDGLWPDSSVRRILRNEMYTGTMIQGRHKVISYKVQVSRAVPEDEWIRVEGTHEAIITRETFDLVQQMLSRDTRTAPGQQHVDLFSGLLRCADCGRSMSKKLISQPYRSYNYYLCSTYKKMNSGACTKHTIRSDTLAETVLTVIQQQIDLAVEMDELLDRISRIKQTDHVAERLEQSLAAKTAERAHVQSLLVDIYPDYKAGLLSQDTYKMLQGQYERQIRQIDNAISDLRSQLDSRSNDAPVHSDYITMLMQQRNITTLTREMLVSLIDTIHVHEGGDIDIVFRFSDAIKDAKEYIDRHKHILAAAAAGEP